MNTTSNRPKSGPFGNSDLPKYLYANADRIQIGKKKKKEEDGLYR
jgi:hypothetical protein